MKIALIVGDFPSVSETFIINQIVDLIRKGHQILIFAYRENTKTLIHSNIKEYKLLEKTEYHKDTSVSLPWRYFDFLKFLFKYRGDLNFLRLIQLFNYNKQGKKAYNLREYTKYKWILDKGPFDVIHVHFAMNALQIAEMKNMGYFSRTKFITSFHGYDIHPALLDQYRIKYKLLFRECDLFIVNSKYTESLLLQITSPDKVTQLPVGLETSKFSKKNNSKTEFWELLFVGRLTELKGPIYCIRILNELINRGNKNLKLTIVGEGELQEELMNLIKSLKLEDNVHLTGALTQEEIINIMERADIFLFPGIIDKTGRAETQGLVIQEAQSMGLPVLVSDVGGMKYGLIDGETGFVLKEKDINGFSDKIEYLIKNEDKRIEMGVKGREFVKKYFDSSIIGKQLENFYRL